MAENSDSIKKIREYLLNKFIIPAKTYGQQSIAIALEKVMPKLTPENVVLKIGEEVTDVSLKAKTAADVGPDKPLDIVTLFPDWLKKEKSVLHDQAEKGPVEIRIRGYQQIPEPVIQDMQNLGINVTSSSEAISLNLTIDDATLYYTSQPQGSHSSLERISIRISGKVGKALSLELRAAQNETIIDESTLGSLEIAYKNALEKIVKDPIQQRKLKEMLRNDELQTRWRVILILHYLQSKDDRYYSIVEIAKELECSLERIRSCVYTWYKYRNLPQVTICEFDFANKGNEKVKLMSKAKEHAITLTLYQILSYLVSSSDKEAKEMMEKYDLPPGRKKGLFKGIR
jgi:hypothetical protein